MGRMEHGAVPSSEDRSARCDLDECPGLGLLPHAQKRAGERKKHHEALAPGSRLCGQNRGSCRHPELANRVALTWVIRQLADDTGRVIVMLFAPGPSGGASSIGSKAFLGA
jgi:hypothetical protein